MSNFTTPEKNAVDFYYIFTVLIICVFIVVAFVGNLIVIVVFFSTKELQTQVNYFLASLAFADLLTAAFPMPMWLAYRIRNYKPFSLALFKVWRCADLTFCTASIWNLCAISIDRCLAISWPFRHRAFLTPFRIKCAVALVWGYSCTITILITDTVVWKKRGLLISLLSYYIPTVIIIVAYLTIYVSQVKSRFEFSQRENIDVSSTNRTKQDIRMAKYMILLIASFLICWAGHFIMGTMYAFTVPKLHPFVKDCLKAMSYLNSAMNPFLYGYVSPKFRVAFKGIFRRRRPKNSRHAWGQMSPARGAISQKTSTTKLVERPSTGSQESAV
ncbi:beta-1 adrenergic receptor-like [Dendronephthya gigantea]|uniref:beta-1 adrenergic receptor-like n=1 Tax=Dendronephthya gigantea TaxID=151771 RepID=UPI00106DAD7D|nr:beta-1 adrenergic receptor-like [Dendronephthya gigantea]